MKEWARMTWKEIDSLDRNILLILPVGSTEQHGERLPVGTDHFFAQYFAKRLARKILNSVLLPNLNYGMSWHHSAFPGTVYIDGSVYTLLIRNILNSLCEAGFRNIIVVNGHGGNKKWIEQAIKELKEIYPDVKMRSPVDEMTLEEFKEFEKQLNESTVHAGAMEVSMLAAIFPEYVKDSSAVTHAPTKAKWGEGTDSPSEWKRKFPTGQKGNQKGCRINLGKKINKLIFDKIFKTAKEMTKQ